jgi:LysR family transcriptional regulator, nod-box dependent transcriptional activator
MARGGISAVAADERALAARLRRINLDLLPVLHELLRTRSVTRTARSFGMTQPAVSRALRQLRAAFEDELLVSLGREAQLTERAEALIGPLQRALGEIDVLVRPANPFDPAIEPVHIVITTADYVSLLLAPLLAEICTAEAPQAVFEFVNAPMRNAEDLARVDFLIAPRAFGETLGKRIGSMPLWRDDIVCIAAAANTAVPECITPEAYQRARHAGFQPNPRIPPSVHALLQPTSSFETGRFCTVPDFLVLGAIVEKAGCLALVPRKLALELVLSRALRIVEVAYSPKEIFIDAYWSLAANGKRGHVWFRQILARAAQGLAA